MSTVATSKVKPIGVALVGLSASAKTSWAATAHLPYLKEAEEKGHYKIVALLNSSKEAAERAVQEFKLDPSVSAYGSPGELAKDPAVDLVVVSTRVDVHWPTVKPSIEAGKAAFIEWPLAKSLSEAEQLASAARKASLPSDRIIVGLQNRLDPTFQMLDRVVDTESRLGKIHSVDYRGNFSYFAPVMSASVDYFNDLSVGGNMVSIYLIHQLDAILYSMGDATVADSSARLLTGYKTVDLVDGEFGHDPSALNNVKKNYPRNTHDQVMLHGRLKSTKSDNVDGALFTVHVRGGEPFKDEQDGGASLRIYGEKGEIHLSAPDIQLAVGVGGTQKSSFKLFDHQTKTVEVLQVDNGGNSSLVVGGVDLSNLNPHAQNTGRLYEYYRQKREGLPTLDDALKRHEFIEALFRSNVESGGV